MTIKVTADNAVQEIYHIMRKYIKEGELTVKASLTSYYLVHIKWSLERYGLIFMEERYASLKDLEKQHFFIISTEIMGQTIVKEMKRQVEEYAKEKE